MAPFRKPTLVTLRRQNPNQPWGFRLGGGAEIGQPFQIQKVTPDSLAWLGGLSEGDELVRIGNISLRGLTHDEVQQIIMRCIYCIDLFILREDGQEIQPRILRNQEIISERSDVPYMDRPQHFSPLPPQGYIFNRPPMSSGSPQPPQQPIQQQQEGHFDASKAPGMQMMSPSSQQQQQQPQQQQKVMQNGNLDYNDLSSRPFQSPSSPQPQQQQPQYAQTFKPVSPNQMDSDQRRPEQQQQQQQQHPQQQSNQNQQQQPGQRPLDTRVFGVNPRASSKSPIRLNHSISLQGSSPSTNPPASSLPHPQHPQQQRQPQQQQQPFSQSTPTTPTIGKNFNYTDTQQQQQQQPTQNDMNNNPMSPTPGGDKKIFGVPNRITIKPIAPIGNHGIQPVQNEKKYFGINVRQRLNSVSSDRDWKDPLPIVNIPNTDQLLPSQARQMQTYINQIPPTEKNLRPSLAGLQRRRIRPVWPPPSPRIQKGTYVEGQDGRMYEWPPSRAQSVDRDFGYGEPSRDNQQQQQHKPPQPFHNFGRVRSSTRIWPPPSNATPAGKSGYIPDGDGDDENYAYNRNNSREPSPSPSWINSHIPITYRPPPGTQYTPTMATTTTASNQVVNDF